VRVALFKNSEVSFLQLLDDTDVSYEKLYPASSSVMASGTMIVLGQTAAIAGSMAAIIVAWLKARSSRKVIITLKDKQKELLQLAEQIAVIDRLPHSSTK
jgi:hypothetical protein